MILEKSIINEKEITVAVSIDIVGAFDNTKTEDMLRSLDNYPIENWTKKWIKAMLENRVIKAQENSEKIFSPKQGCPQGGCLSALLWSIVIDTLIKELRKANYKVVAYADDLLILVSGKYINIISDVMNGAMKIVEDWCRKFSLEVNPDKTKIMKFTRKTKKENLKLKDIKIFGKKLEEVKEIKYLGIYLDPKLNMNRHIQKIRSKAISSLWASRSLVNRTWGLKPSMMMWVYKQIILPRMTYGSLVWWDKINGIAAAALEKVQRFALLMVTGAMKSTPTLALNVALNIEPIKLKIEIEAIKARHRLTINGEWRNSANNCNHGKSKVFQQILKQEYGNLDICKTTKPIRNRYEVSISKRDQWDCQLNKEINPVIWYSDGSKKDGRAGAGFFSPTQNRKGHLRISDWSTIMQAEAMGIIGCIENSDDIRGRNVVIASDSQALLKALKKTSTQSKTIESCQKKLNQFAIRNKVTLIWSPGHVQIDGNEEADRLAKEGTEKAEIDKETFMPECILKNLINAYRDKTFSHIWEHSDKMRFSKLMMPKISNKRAETLIKMNRKNLRAATGILTGMCCLNGHLKRMRKITDGSCRKCGEPEESMEHVLTECPAYTYRRMTITTHPTLAAEQLEEISISKWLKYLKDIKLFDTFFKID